MTEHSRINEIHMEVQERMAAIRFMFLLDEDKWIHIKTMPDYVFRYIYEVGTLEDLPWIRFQDDDLGSRVRRIRISDHPMEVGQMIKDSPLINQLDFKDISTSLYLQEIGVMQFERLLLEYCKRNLVRFKNTQYIRI